LAEPVALGDDVELPRDAWEDFYHPARACPPLPSDTGEPLPTRDADAADTVESSDPDQPVIIPFPAPRRPTGRGVGKRIWPPQPDPKLHHPIDEGWLPRLWLDCMERDGERVLRSAHDLGRGDLERTARIRQLIDAIERAITAQATGDA
jgi:hypothetical protein